MGKDLDRLIGRMLLAFGENQSTDFSSVVITHRDLGGGDYIVGVNYNEGVTEVALDKSANELINNIARAKDHLKIWCDANGKGPADKKGVEQFVGANRAVALIHDLWNVDKHEVLDEYPGPRSGHEPQLVDFERVAGTMADMSTRLVVYARIVDVKTGEFLGHFPNVCIEAVELWLAKMKALGVTIPTDI